MDDEDEYQNTFHFFVLTLEVLRTDAEQQCERVGHFNVAYETKYELVKFGNSLFTYRSCKLPTHTRESITELVQLSEQIPSDVLNFTDIASESLLNMRHPAWAPLRAKAKHLLEILKPDIEENRKYFDNEARKPFMGGPGYVASYLESALNGKLFRQDWLRFVQTPLDRTSQMEAIRAGCSLIDQFGGTGTGERIEFTPGARVKVENFLKSIKSELGYLGLA